jgi:hypothetical protein
MESTIIINELVDKQIDKENIPKPYKLYYSDILRLSSKLSSSIFIDAVSYTHLTLPTT